MIERYTRPAMGRIWTDENKFRCWLQWNRPPSQCWPRMVSFPPRRPRPSPATAGFSVERIQDIEAEVKHDVIAFTTAVAETLKAQGLDDAVALAALRAHIERHRRHGAGLAGQGSLGADSRRA